MSSSRVVTLSHDGTGDYMTVQEAIDTVPLSNTCRTVIRIAPGVYKQPLYVPKTKNFITLAGFTPEATVLTWNNTATPIDHHQDCGDVTVKGVASLMNCQALEDLLLRHNGIGIGRNFISHAASRMPLLRMVALDICDAKDGGFDLPDVLPPVRIPMKKLWLERK